MYALYSSLCFPLWQSLLVFSIPEFYQSEQVCSEALLKVKRVKERYVYGSVRRISNVLWIINLVSKTCFILWDFTKQLHRGFFCYGQGMFPSR